MRLWVDPPAWAELKVLPGHMRHRMRRAVEALAQDPRPPQSEDLELPPEVAAICPPGVELRRLRIERWRVVYAVDDEWDVVTVLAVRRRPPYQYEDLMELVAQL